MRTSGPPLISQTAQYALQALVYLARHAVEEPVLGHVIAEATGIPSNYLGKILHTLGKTGIVDARRGKQGGYSLGGAPADLGIREVFAAFDDLSALDGCLLGRPECSEEDPCAAHAQWRPIAEELRRFLDETTLEDLARGGAAVRG